MHFMDVQKVYFHKIVLDEWEWMNFMDFIKFIHFWCSFNFNEFVKIEKLISYVWWELFFSFTWSEYPSSQISTLIFIINSKNLKFIQNKQNWMKKNEINENWINFWFKVKIIKEWRKDEKWWRIIDKQWFDIFEI